MSIRKGDVPITTLEQWGRIAGPKRPDQWAEHRSAMEVGRAWLEGDGDMPREVASALESHADFGPILAWSAEPEVKLPFDDYPGEPRNTDLLVEVTDARGDYLLAVEAKADESFGESLAQTRSTIDAILARGERTNRWPRLQQLALSLLGAEDPMSPPFACLRYQLLTACAGVLRAGQLRGHKRAVMLVQEFVTPRTVDVKHARNAADFVTFIRAITRNDPDTQFTGDLVGPIRVPGAPLFNEHPALYIGKVSRRLR